MDFLKQHLNNATQHLEAKNTTSKKRVTSSSESGPLSKKQKVQSHPQHQFNHMIAAKKVVAEEQKKRGKWLAATQPNHSSYHPLTHLACHTLFTLADTMKMLALTIPKKKNKKQMKRLMNSIPTMKKSKKVQKKNLIVVR